MYKPKEITNEEYHGKKEYESSTNLRHSLISPKKYLHGKTAIQVPTKAMEEGTAVHTFFLENNKFHDEYIFRPEGLNARTKEGKEWMKENEGKKILSYEWKENLELMNESIMNSPAKIIYNNDNYSELSFFWDDLYGIRGKCRPDCLSYNGRFVLDLKTTQDASPKGFQKSIGAFGYHIQAAWYLRGLRKLGVKVDEFLFVAIEKTAPFCVGVYRADKEMLEEGEKKVEEALNIIQQCNRSRHWADYTPEILDISLPPWMVNKKNQPQQMEEIELY